jgi:hypothetical protein
MGRKVRYKSYHKIVPVWKPVEGQLGSDDLFKYQVYADIPRLTYGIDGENEAGTFRLYKFKLLESLASPINIDLSSSIIAEASTSRYEYVYICIQINI